MLVAEQSSGRTGHAPFSLHPFCSLPLSMKEGVEEEEEEEEEEGEEEGEEEVYLSQSFLRADRGAMTSSC